MVFFGAGTYGLPALEALVQSRHQVAAVVTSADKPRGRSLQVEPSPIKEAAIRHRLPVLEYDKSRSADILSAVRKLSPDFLIVVSFGFLLSREFLNAPKIAPLNIHPSLLPRHRGASPMPWTLLEGDRRTGVTLIWMNERMDAGPIVAQAETPVAPDENLLSLEKKLSALGASLVVETLDAWQDGRLGRGEAQDESQATYTRKFTKEDARLDFSLSAETLARRVRAFKGWPGTYAVLHGKRLLVHEAGAVSGAGECGSVLSVGDQGIAVAAKEGALLIRTVQLEGKKTLAVKEFLRGFPIRPGERFE